VFDHRDIDRYRPNLLSQLMNSILLLIVSGLDYTRTQIVSGLDYTRTQIVSGFGSFGRCSAELNLLC
jgi:hypothetical protein